MRQLYVGSRASLLQGILLEIHEVLDHLQLVVPHGIRQRVEVHVNTARYGLRRMSHRIRGGEGQEEEQQCKGSRRGEEKD
jgi:hypothetical protein